MLLKEYGNWTLIIPLKQKIYYLPGHLDLQSPKNTHLHYQVVHHLKHGRTIRKYFKDGRVENHENH